MCRLDNGNGRRKNSCFRGSEKERVPRWWHVAAALKKNFIYFFGIYRRSEEENLDRRCLVSFDNCGVCVSVVH